MLGQAVCGAAQRLGHEVTAAARADLDVTDLVACDGMLERVRPDAVVNCAAWTDVDGAETQRDAAMAVNATGAGNIARSAAEVHARVVHVSTDYVFDGSKAEPWIESDPVNPLSVYGVTKLHGEEEVAAATDAHAIVRTSWLFGVGGRNFVETMLGLGAEGQEVSVVTDQVGCPTWTGHLAGALVELAERRDFGVHHVAGGGHCSWNELTVEAFDQAGVECRVLPATTDAFPRPAPRPAYSVLASERADAIVLPSWQDGVRGYLADRLAGAGPAAPRAVVGR